MDLETRRVEDRWRKGLGAQERSLAMTIKAAKVTLANMAFDVARSRWPGFQNGATITILVLGKGDVLYTMIVDAWFWGFLRL